jgi:hypothetical protein
MPARQRMDIVVQRVSLGLAFGLLLASAAGAQEYRATITAA